MQKPPYVTCSIYYGLFLALRFHADVSGFTCQYSLITVRRRFDINGCITFVVHSTALIQHSNGLI